jgi:hypothetical protein
VELGRRGAWWHPEKYLLQVEAKYYLKCHGTTSHYRQVIRKNLGYIQKTPANVYLRPYVEIFSRRVIISIIKFYANPSCGTHGRIYVRTWQSQKALCTTVRTHLKSTSLNTRCPARQLCRTLTALGLPTLRFGNSLTTHTELSCNRIYKIYYVFFSPYRWGQYISNSERANIETGYCDFSVATFLYWSKAQSAHFHCLL